MISRSTIDKVFETARVEEVIGDFVTLKRAGSNLKGLSPFSDERSPSFMVSPVKQIWKDFSSGKGGNAVTFIMEHEHFTFPEAIRYLAKKYHIEIEETESTDAEKAQMQEKESMYVVTEFARDFFVKSLWKTDEGLAIAHSYFKERGFTDATIEKFQLGYSPDQREALTKDAIKKGYQLEYLEKTGLSIVKENQSFDRFRGRVMFPIHSMSGRVLGFGGRILISDKKLAKYVNSPESEIYHKSQVLYGMFQAKQAIAKLQNCYLVEGYTDVIQFHQAGIENVVASSGTALTPDQIRMIQRLTENITVLFDGDAAGLRAAIRGIDLILEAGMNVRVCRFPEGEDPDSFAKKMPHDELLAYLENESQDFIQFKASLLNEEAAGDPIKKAGLIRDIIQSIAKIPSAIQREIYVQSCAKIMDISESVLFDTLAQILKKEKFEQAKKAEPERRETFEVISPEEKTIISESEILHDLETKALSCLVLYGNKRAFFNNYISVLNDDGEIEDKVEIVEQHVYERLFLEFQEDEIHFTQPLFKQIYHSLMQEYQSRGAETNIDQWMRGLETEQQAWISNLLMNEEKYHLHKWTEKKQVYVKDKDHPDAISRLVVETVNTLREYLIKKVIDGYIDALKKQEDSHNILQMVSEYNKLKSKITNRLGRMRTGHWM